MALLDIRQRSGYLFLAVMLGHVLLISAQVNSRAGVPVLEAVTFGLFAEVQRATSSVISGVQHVWSGYVGLRHVKAENDELRSAAGGGRRSRCRSSARSPIARAGSSGCSICATGPTWPRRRPRSSPPARRPTSAR